MSRHSKHANDRSFYSYKERQSAGYAGTRKDILGTDCFLPFGYCALSLKPPKDPVVTPDGWVYDREFILESLLTQKLELQAKAKKYQEQELRKERKDRAEQQQAELKQIEDFQKTDQGLVSEDLRHKRALEGAASGASASEAGRPEKKLRQGELLVVDKKEHRQKSFWAKDNTPSAPAAELEKVDTTSRCPMSGKKLRVKDLIPFKFEITDQKMLDKGGDRGVFCCAVSKHPITHQQAYLIKPSGQVVLENVLKDCVLKEMRCPVTGTQLKGKEDLLKLQQGNTGFSAHNEVEAKVFSHIRSRAGDDRTQQGHLPRAGFVGLH